MSDPVKALLSVPCAQHVQGGAVAACPTCGTPVAVYAELIRLRARVAELEQRASRAEVQRDAIRNEFCDAVGYEPGEL